MNTATSNMCKTTKQMAVGNKKETLQMVIKPLINQIYKCTDEVGYK